MNVVTNVYDLIINFAIFLFIRTIYYLIILKFQSYNILKSLLPPSEPSQSSMLDCLQNDSLLSITRGVDGIKIRKTKRRKIPQGSLGTFSTGSDPRYNHRWIIYWRSAKVLRIDFCIIYKETLKPYVNISNMAADHKHMYYRNFLTADCINILFYFSL